tara:strand:- start:870 stop:1079 length:210 start_codon:yes stop_codon:yes gene_type:complete
MKKKMYKRPTPHNLLSAYRSLAAEIEDYFARICEPLTEEKFYEMRDEAFDHIAFLYKKIPVGQIKGGKK